MYEKNMTGSHHWRRALGALALSLLWVGISQAQAPASAQQSGAPVVMHLMVGRSLVLSSPTRLKRVAIADPSIVDAIIVSPNQILLNGKAAGDVTLELWDENDQNQPFDVVVDLDTLAISEKIREVFPQEPVTIGATKDTVVVSGHASSKDVADKIIQVVTAATPKVINLIEVPLPPPPGEVQLAVKFAEVDRAALSQFGLNLFAPGTTATGPASTVGVTGTQQFAPPQLTNTGGSSTQIGLTDLLNIFLFRRDIDLGATIKALQQNNLLQVLAEPNLLTEMGKEASFLAGGEFPFPIVQSGTGSTAVTIQFKEFGIRLSFTPTLTPDGKIHLKVEPEVSALDFANALTISGFTIPALSTRRVSSEMDLDDGQSFAIAGLVNDQITKTAQRVPFLSDLPALGRFFRSWSDNKTKTELLVVVTPRIVKPLQPDQVPAGPVYPSSFLPPATPETTKPVVK